MLAFPPATVAIIPDFLWFRVANVELNFGPAHARYDMLQRGLEANLEADPNQRIATDAGFLDACEGSLHIVADETLETEWSGHIVRHRPYAGAAKYRSGDYAVYLALRQARFDELMAVMQTGQELFGLLLDFQNIHRPDDPHLNIESEAWDTLWDDVNYPNVALTSFMMRWKPQGKSAKTTYSWPNAGRISLAEE